MLCTMLGTETGKAILLEVNLVMNEYSGTQGTNSVLDFWSHSICLMNLYLIFSVSIHAVYLSAHSNTIQSVAYVTLARTELCPNYSK